MALIPSLQPPLNQFQRLFAGGLQGQREASGAPLGAFQGQGQGVGVNSPSLLGLQGIAPTQLGLSNPQQSNFNLAGAFADAQTQIQQPIEPPSLNGSGSVGFKTDGIGSGSFGASSAALANVGQNIGPTPTVNATQPTSPTAPIPAFTKEQEKRIGELLKTTDKSGLAKGFDLAKTGTDIVGGLASIYFSSQGLKEARKQFDFNRNLTNRNLQNRAAGVNQDLGARFRRTLQSSTGQAIAADDPRVQAFVNQNGANGSAI